MKSVNQTTILSILIFFTLTLLIGCGAPKPSGSVVKKLVEEELSKGVPTSWVKKPGGGTVFWTQDTKLKTVKIEEWGKFNKARQYWPAKIRVVGSAKAEVGFFDYRTLDFDKVADFLFYQDDFGKWQVSKR